VSEMDVVRTIAELRRRLLPERRAGRTIGLVPTMGYLHEGHMALVSASVARCDVTVVSIFVNPTQFGAEEDLAAYPRDLDADAAACRAAGVDVLFVPEMSEVYREGFETHVEPGPLAAPLCGAFRPGHFRGVATVVAKLFNMVQPDVAFFGRKDFQQSVVIRRMATDLDMPLEVATIETVRDPDGMAMSSRNARLDVEERARALGLSRGLFAAQRAFAAGERDPDVLVKTARAEMGELDRIEYLELADAATLRRIEGAVDHPASGDGDETEFERGPHRSRPLCARP
jgi:pantoate--beta-alanine ligase